MDLSAETLRVWLKIAEAAIREQQDYLTQLDAAIGDADHGSNMSRALGAAVARADAIEHLPMPGHLLVLVGEAILSAAGGAAGALWGKAFSEAGSLLADSQTLGTPELAALLEGALAGVVDVGAADEGEKTMVDALAPAARILREHAEAGAPPPTALTAARAAAEVGMRQTVSLRATKGRASYLGDRSIGHQDPGATSTVIVLKSLEDAATSASGRRAHIDPTEN